MPKKVRVRNAPSPTGFLHIGSIRTFLYNFLFARQAKGVYVLRIEDTDRERLVPGSIENIVQSLAQLGIATDEGPYWENGEVKVRGDYGPYIQSERKDIYKQYALELVEKKAAYYCFCTPQRLEELRKQQQEHKLPPRYDKRCLNLTQDEIEKKISAGEKFVVRLNVPADKIITYNDHVHGKMEVHSKEVDDQVLLKSDGYPTYHLGVVVDDHLMEISHIIRADEWIPSTPKHILLYEAFGWEKPEFVHLPPVLSKTTGKKMSKREGDVAVNDFLAKGYLPEAMINFLAFLGWNPKTEQEIFSMDELIQQFSLDKLNKAGAVFDMDKLDWFNGVYIRKMNISELTDKCLPYLDQAGIDYKNSSREFLEKVISLEQERLKKLSEIGERVKYFFSEPQYDPAILVWKKSDKEAIKKSLELLKVFLPSFEFAGKDRQTIEVELKKFIVENNLKTGEVLWPLRVALTGMEASPGPFEILETLGVLDNGKQILVNRINQALNLLN